MNIIIDLSNIMYNELWIWNKTKLNWTKLNQTKPNQLKS
jgi:hypothetical protein